MTVTGVTALFCWFTLDQQQDLSRQVKSNVIRSIIKKLYENKLFSSPKNKKAKNQNFK